MTQPAITLVSGSTTIDLDPDLQWQDEFDWSSIEESEERGITGALIVDIGVKVGGRPITLGPSDDGAAWMVRATLTALQELEKTPGLIMSLSLRGDTYQVKFHRANGAPIEAHPVDFVANPEPGGFGDWYLVTLRFIEV